MWQMWIASFKAPFEDSKGVTLKSAEQYDHQAWKIYSASKTRVIHIKRNNLTSQVWVLN